MDNIYLTTLFVNCSGRLHGNCNIYAGQ